MAFALPDHWVWDFWIADDGDAYHLFFLCAPTSLGDPERRHRHAVIGRASSVDLIDWEHHGQVLGPGVEGTFDEAAVWTGCTVPAPDGSWRLFYTGARFPDPSTTTNVETIGVATSTDLQHWTKGPGPVLRADPRWYETLPDGTWPEEACRDPWVLPLPDGGWGMLHTARARPDSGSGGDTGVLGWATSPDLEDWTSGPPRTAPGAGFQHLEVPAVVTVDGREALIFSCPTSHLTGARQGEVGGVWAAPVRADGRYDLAAAALLVDESRYSGRVVTDRAGRAVLLTDDNRQGPGWYAGGIGHPQPLRWDGDRLVLS